MLAHKLWIGGSATGNNALVGLRPLAMTRGKGRDCHGNKLPRNDSEKGEKRKLKKVLDSLENVV